MTPYSVEKGILILQTVAITMVLVLSTIAIYKTASENTKEDVIEATVSKNHQFISCPSCHVERREPNGCGKLKHEAWAICIHKHYAFKL